MEGILQGEAGLFERLEMAAAGGCEAAEPDPFRPRSRTAAAARGQGVRRRREAHWGEQGAHQSSAGGNERDEDDIEALWQRRLPGQARFTRSRGRFCTVLLL